MKEEWDRKIRHKWVQYGRKSSVCDCGCIREHYHVTSQYYKDGNVFSFAPKCDRKP